MSTLSFARTVTEIQVGLLAKKKKIFCQNTKVSSKLCSFLLHHGLLQQYTLAPQNRYELDFKTIKNINVLKKLQLVSKPSGKKFYSLYKIKTLIWKNKNHIYVIAAKKIHNKNLGFITQYQAIINRVGGEILLKIETI